VRQHPRAAALGVWVVPAPSQGASPVTVVLFSGKLITAAGVAGTARVRSNLTRGRAGRLGRLRRGAEVARQPRPSRLPPPWPDSQVFVIQENRLWPGAFTHGLSAMTGLGLFCHVTLEPHNDLPWGSFLPNRAAEQPECFSGKPIAATGVAGVRSWFGSVSHARAGSASRPPLMWKGRLARHVPLVTMVQTCKLRLHAPRVCGRIAIPNPNPRGSQRGTSPQRSSESPPRASGTNWLYLAWRAGLGWTNAGSAFARMERLRQRGAAATADRGALPGCRRLRNPEASWKSLHGGLA
jgi:hypothetical protein